MKSKWSLLLPVLLLGSGVFDGQLHAASTYELALKAAGNDQFEEALRLLQAQISEDTSFTEAYVRLADFALYGDRLSQTETFFRGLMDAEPGNANLYIGAAVVARHAAQRALVFENTKVALEKGATEFIALELLVDSALQLKRTDQLSAILSKLRKRPGQAHLYELGYALWRYRIRNFRRAKSTIEKYLADRSDYFGHKTLGEIEQATGNLEKSISAYKRAISISAPSRVFFDISIQSALASCYIEMDRLDSASYFFSEALTKAKAIGALNEALEAHKAYLPLLVDRARYLELYELCSSGILLATKLKDVRAAQSFHFYLAHAGMKMGDNTQALRHFKLSTEMAQDASDFNLTAKAFCEIGRLMTKQGLWDPAEKSILHGLQLSESQRLADVEHQCRLAYADVKKEKGEVQRAKENYERVLRYAQATKQYGLAETCFTRLAHLFQDRASDSEAAWYYLSLADALARQTLQPQLAATSRWMQGRMALAQKDVEHSETLFLDAIQLGRDTGAYSAMVAGTAGLIQTYEMAGFDDLALGRIDSLLTYVRRFATLSIDENVSEYLDLAQDLFLPAVETLSQMGKVTAMFDVFEKYKAFKHLLNLSNLQHRFRNSILDSTQSDLSLERDQIRKNWASIWKLWEKDRGDHASQVAALQDEIATLLLATAEQQARLEQRHPILANLNYPATASIYDLRDALQRLDSVFLHYLVGEKSTSVLLVRADSVFFRQVDIRKEKLTQMIKQVTPGFSSGQPQSVFRADVAKQLYELLFQPIRTWIPDGSTLVISPDGILNHLSFDCLVSESPELVNNFDYQNVRFLVEDFSIAYVPFAKFLHWSTDKSDRMEVLGVFANQPSEEIEQVRNEIGVRNSKTFTNDDCTKTRFLTEGPNFQILHVATPGIVDRSSPLYSKILFDESARASQTLTGHEFFQQEFNTDLIVFSALQWSEDGGYPKEEGLQALLHALNYAGIPRVVANLWAPMLGSSQILADFYANLKSGGNTAEALRLAKLSGMTENRNPYYWSNYTLFGRPNVLRIRSSRADFVIGFTVIASLAFVVALAWQYRRVKKEHHRPKSISKFGQP